MPAPLRQVFRSGTVAAALAALSTLTACSASPPPAPPPASTAAPVPSAAAPSVATPPPSTDVAAPSATVSSAAVVPGRTRVVVLDPGHNGGNSKNLAAINRQVPDGRGGTKACNTTGTATDGGYAEHTFNFAVAQLVEKRLEAQGVRVVMTRANDTGVGPCVDVRGHAGEKADADAVVSIHADGAAPSGHGFHVAYSDPPLNDVQRGAAHTLAADVRDAMLEAGFTRSTYIGHDGLSARSDLAGLNLATRPTVLVECANMRNATEAAVVSSTAGQERYAAAIAGGIERFLSQ